MAEIKHKHAKRIRDLIKAKWAAIVLLVGGILMPPLSPIPVLVGLLYGFEAKRFLRLYPDMDTTQAAELQSAKNMYFIMAYVHMGLWLLIGAVIAIAIVIMALNQ